ncbi:MAG: rhomboid family intramembrane serine protease, partial [Halobacteriales archaeon]|nr:rhomboid family intramembrane serine protease [Halobacteriales archaeon]
GLALAVWRRFPMAYTMALLCIGVFVVQIGSQGARIGCAIVTPQGIDRADCVLADLSFIASPFLQGDRLLTPLTYMFVHADILHIAGNMFILLTAGPALEERVGSRNFLLLYIVAGLAGAFATIGLWKVGFQPGLMAFAPNVGASGAIFGVLTAFAVLAPREKLPMMMPMGFFMFWMPSLFVLLLYLGFNLVYVVSNTNIAWWGHFAGFLVGLALGPVLVGKLKPAARGGKPVNVDVEALRPLARTHMQRSALAELQRLQAGQTHDDAQLQQVWLERFGHAARCPECEAAMVWDGGTLACPQGHVRVAAVAG